MPGKFCVYCGVTHKSGVRCNETVVDAEVAHVGSGVLTRHRAAMAKQVKSEVGVPGIHEERGLEEESERVGRVEVGSSDMADRLRVLEKRLERMQLEKSELLPRDLDIHSRKRLESPVGEDEGREEHYGVEDDSRIAYSSYGRSRHRSRHRSSRRHTRHASTSSSRSGSSSRRRRSKWSIRKFTFGNKRIKNLNAYELLGATAMWALSIETMTVADYRALLEHMAFISNRAMTGDFKDSAHVEYDMAIRRKAESVGFVAFTKSYTGISVLYYGTQHLRYKNTFSTTVGRRPSQNVNRACYKWNSDAGCPKLESECFFGHFCSKCGLKNHRRNKCKD